MVDTKHLVLNQEDLVVEVAHHQLEEVVQLNHHKATQVGINMDMLVARVEIVAGPAVAAVVPVALEIPLLVQIVVDLVVMEEHFQVIFLQHMVIMVISVAAVAVVETRPRVLLAVVDLVVVDEDVVMKTPLTPNIQRLMDRLKPVVAVVEIEMHSVVEMVELVLSSLEFLLHN